MTTTFDEFEQHIHHVVPAYTDKEEVGRLKKEIETLKAKKQTNKQTKTQHESSSSSLRFFRFEGTQI